MSGSDERFLVGRDEELAVIGDTVAAVSEGRRAVVVVSGSMGLGKTALLARTRADAQRAGLLVLDAAAAEYERDTPFALARRLLSPAVVRADRWRVDSINAAGHAAALLFREEGVRPLAVEDIVYGLYWLVLELTEVNPVVILADDLQWADEPSLRWLATFSHSGEDVPVGIVVASREHPHTDGRLAVLFPEPPTRHLPLSPLSLPQTTQLVRAVMPDAELSHAIRCHEASGGNPFLVHALVGQADIVDWDSPSPAPATVTRRVVGRLEELGREATRFATALAALGDGVELRHLACAASLDPRSAARAVAALAAEGLLSEGVPPAFRHAILRAAVPVSDNLRSELHDRLSRVLHEEGRDDVEVASRILHTLPEAAAWRVPILRSAAASASAAGAHQSAIAYLTRALAEPPSHGDRFGVLFELGLAQLHAADPDAAATLAEADKQATDTERSRLASPRLAALIAAGRLSEGVALAARMFEEMLQHDREAALRVGAEAAIWIAFGTRAAESMIELLEQEAVDASGATAAERALLAALAFRRALSGAGSAVGCADLATRAYAGGRLLSDGPTAWPATAAAATAAVHAEAMQLGETMMFEARRQPEARGSRMASLHFDVVEAGLASRRGDLPQAIGLCEAAINGSLMSGARQHLPVAAQLLVDCLLERGEAPSAEAVLDELGFLDGGDTVAVVLYARGLLRIAQRRHGDAVADLTAARKQQALWLSGTFVPWRSTLARALVALGERREGRRLVEEELSLARRWGTARGITIGLTRLAPLLPPDEQVPALEEAVTVSVGSVAVLQHAHALAALGMALRRENHRADAQRLLLEAAEVAHHCGATRLIHECEAELRAAGARPRRLRLTGPDALTPMQRRVAELASTGMTNRDIAEHLFVSPKTVETHLSAAFRKLHVRARSQLADALSAQAATATR